MDSSHSQSAQSHAAYERIELLDVLRGFALYGVFVVNSQFMAMPVSQALEAPTESSLEFVAWIAVQALFLSKFVGIFSLLFGAGFALQSTRAREAGRPFAGTYLWRSALLGAMGLVHGLLLFEGDILLPYAAAGVILLLFRGLGVRGLAVATALCLSCSLLASGAIAAFDVPEDPAAAAASITRHQTGPLGDLIAHRSGAYIEWLLLSSLIGFNWRVLAAFFLGAWLLHTGFFSRRSSAATLRFALATLTLGLVSELGLAWLTHVNSSRAAAMLAAGAHEITGLVLALGYMACIRQVVNRDNKEEAGLILRSLDRLAHWTSHTGRIALTNYLSQSILANLYFTFLGFAWYAQLDRVQLFLLVSATFAGQSLFSVLWVQRFRAGPFEWIWRSAIQLKVLPLRR